MTNLELNLEKVDKILGKLSLNKDLYMRIYSFTTENVGGYIDLFDLKTKSLLTVGSSGDQILNSYYKGCRNITLLDINPFAKYYIYLKIAGIISLDYQEFIEFFFRWIDMKYNVRRYNSYGFKKLSSNLKTLDYDSYCFFEYVLNNYTRNKISDYLMLDDQDNSMVIKQINNYKNYEKINIVVPATVQVTYYFRDCDYKKTNKCFPDKNKIIDIVVSKDGYYDYNENIDYNEYLNREDKEGLIKKTCKDNNCYFEIKDKIRELNINIKNSIKNMNTIITRRGKIQTFIIKVINADQKESRNNIITTYLNKDITVIPNSISDYGVLDKKNNTITWNMSLIDDNSSFELFYDAFVNRGAKTDKIYDTHTVLKSNTIKNHITSNTTNIILIENAIFGVLRDIIIVIIALLIFYKIIDIRNKNMKKDRN